MSPELPNYISAVFGIMTCAILVASTKIIECLKQYEASKLPMSIFVIQILWLFTQTFLSLSGTYRVDAEIGPPKLLVIGIFPPTLLLVGLFITKKGRIFLDSLPLSKLTWLIMAKIPAEVMLLYLFLNGQMPKLMTFQDRSLDFISGISAPFIVYFGFIKRSLNPELILSWNFISLALVMNVFAKVVLPATLPIKLLLFEKPDITLLDFPFVWLPTYIIPIILLAHLTAIRQLLIAGREHR